MGIYFKIRIKLCFWLLVFWMYDPSLKGLEKTISEEVPYRALRFALAKIPRNTDDCGLQIPDGNFFERKFSNSIHVLRKKVRKWDKTWRFSCKNVRNWRKNFSRRV